MSLPKHGANPHLVYDKLGIEQPAKIWDYSENVNALGMPGAVSRKWQELLPLITKYPDPTGEPFLLRVAKYHHISAANVLIGNGASELFMLVAERYRGKRAIIVHPTFSEYETTLLSKNVELTHIDSKASENFELPIVKIIESMNGADVLYLCTPNNPTGMLPSQSDLREIIQYGKMVDCEIVLDEAFIDFVDESLSFIPEIQLNPHVLVIRSMTKMYAIPGIRLGYMVASSDIIKQLKAHTPHWNINRIASEIGAVCLDQQDFRERSIFTSKLERENMAIFLKQYGCTVTQSVANYLSFSLPDRFNSRKFYQDLLSRGIVIRHTENFRGMDGNWFRIGMKSSEMMEHLKKGLSKWFEEN